MWHYLGILVHTDVSQDTLLCPQPLPRKRKAVKIYLILPNLDLPNFNLKSLGRKRARVQIVTEHARFPQITSGDSVGDVDPLFKGNTTQALRLL